MRKSSFKYGKCKKVAVLVTLTQAFALVAFRPKSMQTIKTWKALFHRKFLSSFLLILTQI